MESFLKLAESFNEIVKREGGTKYHRSTHGFIVVLPILHKIYWRYKHYSLSDVGCIINISHAGKYLTMMADGRSARA